MKKDEKGQVLPITAAALLALVVFAYFVLRVIMLFSVASYLQDAADSAAAAAIQPAGNALAGGKVAVNQESGIESAKVVVASSLSQLKILNTDIESVIANTSIEYVSPEEGSCDTFPGSDVCYDVPAARITISLPVSLMGFPFVLTRSSVATIAASAQGSEGSQPVLTVPTPVAIPTEIYKP